MEIIMKKRIVGGIGKMSKYLSKNYYSGSILERANYERNKRRPYKIYGSLIERNMKKDEMSIWQRIRKIILK